MLLSAQVVITFYCAADGRAGAHLAAVKPQPSPVRPVAASNPSHNLRTGIAAGHLPTLGFGSMRRQRGCVAIGIIRSEVMALLRAVT